MSKQTMSKINATAALTVRLAEAIEAAKEGGLSAAEIVKAIEPITDVLNEDES